MIFKNLKPNNCNAFFMCKNPKECVHYKKKEVENPCLDCEGATTSKKKRFPFQDYCHACFAYEEYLNRKNHCKYSNDSGNMCLNTTAIMQAITKTCRYMGVQFKTDGGCKDCKHLDNPLDKCSECSRLEREDYYTLKEEQNESA